MTTEKARVYSKAEIALTEVLLVLAHNHKTAFAALQFDKRIAYWSQACCAYLHSLGNEECSAIKKHDPIAPSEAEKLVLLANAEMHAARKECFEMRRRAEKAEKTLAKVAKALKKGDF